MCLLVNGRDRSNAGIYNFSQNDNDYRCQWPGPGWSKEWRNGVVIMSPLRRSKGRAAQHMRWFRNIFIGRNIFHPRQPWGSCAWTHVEQSKTSMKTIFFEILSQALLQQWTLSRKNHLARRYHSHTKYRHIPAYQHQHYNDHHRNHHDGQHNNEIFWCNLLQVKTAFLGLGAILQLSKNLAVFFIVMVKSFWGADCDLG